MSTQTLICLSSINCFYACFFVLSEKVIKTTFDTNVQSLIIPLPSMMKLLLISCLTLLVVSPALSKCVGSINVKDYGDVYIVAPDWSVGAVTIHDNGFTLRGNSRIYFASRCDDGWNGDMYAQV